MLPELFGALETTPVSFTITSSTPGNVILEIKWFLCV